MRGLVKLRGANNAGQAPQSWRKVARVQVPRGSLAAGQRLRVRPNNPSDGAAPALFGGRGTPSSDTTRLRCRLSYLAGVWQNRGFVFFLSFICLSFVLLLRPRPASGQPEV